MRERRERERQRRERVRARSASSETERERARNRTSGRTCFEESERKIFPNRNQGYQELCAFV